MSLYAEVEIDNLKILIAHGKENANDICPYLHESFFFINQLYPLKKNLKFKKNQDFAE